MKDYNKIIKEKICESLKEIMPISDLELDVDINDFSDADLIEIRDMCGARHIFKNEENDTIAIICDRQEIEDGIWREIK